MSDEESAPKRPKLSHDPNEADVAGPSRTQQRPQPQPSIFKLTIDCFDEIFEYLSLKDLHSFGQTCKTMQQVAGEYFKRNYSAAETHTKKNGIETVYSDNTGVINGRTSTVAFSKFITSITHSRFDIRPLRYIRRKLNEFQSIQRVRLTRSRFNEEKGEDLKKLWPKVETMQIKDCAIREDLDEIFLAHCTNLKRLCVQSSQWPQSDQRIHVLWFQCQYPSLEHFHLDPISPLINLTELFQNNPNITSFSTSGIYLQRYKDEFMQSNIQFDLLKIKGSAFVDTSSLLMALHEKFFFKRLHYHIYTVDEESSEQLTLLPALEKLGIDRFISAFNLSKLIDLKGLVILDEANANGMDILANSLVDLQRVYIGNATIEDILPFIRKSHRLIKLKVIPKNEAVFNGGVLKLVTLNREREKLTGARKLTIFVQDNIFLRTKWTTQNGDTNLNLIEMKRSDSYEWDVDGY